MAYHNSYLEHKTNGYVWQQATVLARYQEFLLPIVKHRKLSWFGHVCQHDTLPLKIIVRVTIEDSRRK